MSQRWGLRALAMLTEFTASHDHGRLALLEEWVSTAGCFASLGYAVIFPTEFSSASPLLFSTLRTIPSDC